MSAGTGTGSEVGEEEGGSWFALGPVSTETFVSGPCFTDHSYLDDMDDSLQLRLVPGPNTYTHPNVALRTYVEDMVTIHGYFPLQWGEEVKVAWIQDGMGFASAVKKHLRVKVCYSWTASLSSPGQTLQLLEAGSEPLWHTSIRVVDGHIGTVVLIVPSPDLEGGELKLRPAEDTGKEATTVACPIVPYRYFAAPVPDASAFVVYIPLGMALCVTPVKNGWCFIAKAPVVKKQCNV
jgi:hypothetical protein